MFKISVCIIVLPEILSLAVFIRDDQTLAFTDLHAVA
jgi:hypothetical protein